MSKTVKKVVGVIIIGSVVYFIYKSLSGKKASKEVVSKPTDTVVNIPTTPTQEVVNEELAKDNFASADGGKETPPPIEEYTLVEKAAKYLMEKGEPIESFSTSSDAYIITLASQKGFKL